MHWSGLNSDLKHFLKHIFKGGGGLIIKNRKLVEEINRSAWLSGRRVARIWKRGGLFWKSEKCANDLDPNCHCSWISFTRFICTKIETKYLGNLGNLKVFSAQNQVVSKKKKRSILRLIFWPKSQIQRFFFRPKSGGLQKKKKKGSSPILRLVVRYNSEFQTSEGGLFSYGGGLFLIFHQKSTSKPPKRCDFAYFTSQWGGSSPPWLRYCWEGRLSSPNCLSTLFSKVYKSNTQGFMFLHF